MTREVFFFDRGGPLLCEDIKRDSGEIRAYVVNGNWHLRCGHGRVNCYDGAGDKRSEHAGRIVRAVAIPSGMRGDYNALIVWAESQTGDRETYRRSPHIFRARGEWRVWFRPSMPADPVILAHEHARHLSGLPRSYQPTARG